MGKRLFCILIGYAFVTTSFAQIKLGLKSGVNLTHPSEENGLKFQTRAGYYAGSFVKIPIATKFNVGSELFYCNTTIGHVDAINSVTSFNYVRLPLLIGYLPAKKVGIHLGPEAGFLLSAHAKNKYNRSNVTNFYVKSDFRLVFGGSYDVTEKVNLNLRYAYGLKGFSKITLSDSNGNDLSEKVNNFPRTIMLGIGLNLIHK